MQMRMLRVCISSKVCRYTQSRTLCHNTLMMRWISLVPHKPKPEWCRHGHHDSVVTLQQGQHVNVFDIQMLLYASSESREEGPGRGLTIKIHFCYVCMLVQTGHLFSSSYNHVLGSHRGLPIFLRLSTHLKCWFRPRSFLCFSVCTGATLIRAAASLS